MYKLYDINVALDTLKCFLLLLLLLLLVHSIVRGPLFLVTPRATKNSGPGLPTPRTTTRTARPRPARRHRRRLARDRCSARGSRAASSGLCSEEAPTAWSTGRLVGARLRRAASRCGCAMGACTSTRCAAPPTAPCARTWCSPPTNRPPSHPTTRHGGGVSAASWSGTRRISAEGVYDTRAGSLCMVACQAINVSSPESDCEVLVTVQFAPMDAVARERTGR